MNHDTEEGWREYVKEELKRISALDDSIGRTLNTVVVGGSVGAIIASINYLKDIAGPNPAAGSLAYLRVSWVVLVIAVAFSIGSLLTSRKAGRLHRDALAARVAKDIEGDARLTRRCTRWNRATKFFHWSGLAGLGVGTGLLIWFAMLNLPPEATAMAEKKGTEKQVREVQVKPDRTTPKPGERPRPIPERREDKSYDHDTSNPFLQRPQTTPPPKDKPEK
jgi:hypothetical protein